MAKRIFILGKPGPDTFALQNEVERALEAEGIKRCTLRIIDDEIVAMEFGVSLFPTLVVDEIVRAIGRVPPKAEIVNLFHLLRDYVPPPKKGEETKSPEGESATQGSSPALDVAATVPEASAEVPLAPAGGSNGDDDSPVA